MYRFLLVLLAAGLAACTGKLEGSACLDGNGNNVCESNEHTLTSIALKITKDGQLLTQTRTNSLGRFSYNIEETGYYCVEVDEPHLDQSLMFQLTYGQIPGEAVELVQSSVSLGPPLGMSAKQLVSPGGPTTGTTTTPTTPTTQQPQEEEEGTPQPLPASPDSAEPGKVCKNVTGMSQTLHVPVRVDYSADVQRMPPRINQERRVGEIFTLPIPVSIGCVLETLYLPDGLIPLWPTTLEEVDKILNIDRETGWIDFRPQARPTSVTLHLKVREDLPLGTHSTQIAPVMLCPGGQRIALNEISIDLIARPFLKILQELPSEAQTAGGEFDWTIVVKNEGRQPLALSVVGNANGPIGSLSPQSALCRSLGSNRIECSLDVEAGQTIPLDVQVQLLDVANDFASFDATAEVENYDETFTASQADVRILP